MKNLIEIIEILKKRRSIKCKKGQPMLGFTEPKSKDCHWTIMTSTYLKVLEEAKQLGISVSTLIELILIERYQLFHLIDEAKKEKS